MLYLCNGFSVGMLGADAHEWGAATRLEFRVLSPRQAGKLLRSNKFVSCFGHSDTARHLGRYLHVWIPVSRDMIDLKPDDRVLVASAKHTRSYEDGFREYPSWKFYLIRRV